MSLQPHVVFIKPFSTVFHFIFDTVLLSVYKILHMAHLNQCLACSRTATLHLGGFSVSFWTWSQWFTAGKSETPVFVLRHYVLNAAQESHNYRFRMSLSSLAFERGCCLECKKSLEMNRRQQPAIWSLSCPHTVGGGQFLKSVLVVPILDPGRLQNTFGSEDNRAPLHPSCDIMMKAPPGST